MGDGDEEREGVEVSRILITRRLTLDDDLVSVDADGVRYVEALGLLMMAGQILDRRHSGDEDKDDE